MLHNLGVTVMGLNGFPEAHDALSDPAGVLHFSACCDNNCVVMTVTLRHFKELLFPRTALRPHASAWEDQYWNAVSHVCFLMRGPVGSAGPNTNPDLSRGAVGAGSLPSCCTTNCRPEKVVAAPRVGEDAVLPTASLHLSHTLPMFTVLCLDRMRLDFVFQILRGMA